MEKQTNEMVDQVIQIAANYGVDIIGTLAILIVG